MYLPDSHDACSTAGSFRLTDWDNAVAAAEAAGGDAEFPRVRALGIATRELHLKAAAQ